MSAGTATEPGAPPPSASGIRRWFVDSRPFPLDPFQQEALDHLDAGRSVLVAAPTGSGKTVVAEYAVARAIAEGGRAFYTTPLKALSNQKYGDLVRAYGREQVGLLTGDVSRNGEAPIVVMTTEVLRNMIYASSGSLKDLRYVVLDEVHYLEDRYRGSVWEEIILSAAPSVVLVCLSATVSNAEELAGWISTVRGSVGTVIEDHRPIDLRQLYLVGDRSAGHLHLFPTFVDGAPNREAAALDERAHRVGRVRPGRGPRASAARKPGDLFRPARAEVVERLAEEELLPAIYFVFSRAGCDDSVRQCLDVGIRLTSREERREIRRIAEEHVDELSDADLKVLNYQRFVSGLESGIAPHHAGMVPPFREAVEDLFAKALVKAVFATETLALGINMPARSVVIDALSKFGGNGHQDLTAGEYTQLTGRAGRRSIDDVGYAAVVYSPFHTFDEVAALAASRSRALRSSFRPNFNMVVNLVRRYHREDTYRLVASSFAQYQSEQPLVRQLDAVLALLEERDYLENWHLTPAGERLSGLYHDCDLLIAEAIGAGLLDGLDAPGLAAVASMFTFEARRQRGPGGLSTPRLARRAASLEELAVELRLDERRLGLPRTRALDSGFASLAEEWCRGADLARLLAPRRAPGRAGTFEPVMSGGDFVRNMKQLIDLLRQIGNVTAGERVGTVARQAAELLTRGIVAASAGAGVVESEEEAVVPPKTEPLL
ncbi:MAG TPA: DEAD/DEAH box helicase [Acidimicrobiales bacterium]|nr:DEAD/DEAH box helicase [Acidimicrobiales bacterium]